MNLGELVTALRTEGGTDATVAQAKSWLNDAHKRMVARAKWRMAQISLGTTVTDQAEYALDSDVVDLEGLLVGSAPYERASQRDLWKLKAGNATLSGPGGVYAPDFTSAGVRQIELYPAPEVDGTAISGLAALLPATLVADADVPIVPEDFHQALVTGAIAIALERQDERLAEAADFRTRFDQEVEMLRRRGNSLIGSGTVAIQVGGIPF